MHSVGGTVYSRMHNEPILLIVVNKRKVGSKQKQFVKNNSYICKMKNCY